MEKWSSQEDAVVIKLYEVCGPQWVTISRTLGGVKSAQQCSQRWHSALRSGINKSPFTTFEHDTVRRLYEVHGPRWARISSYFPDRTPNMIKASREETQVEQEPFFGYNPKTGMESLIVVPVSKSSAQQSADRAGRKEIDFNRSNLVRVVLQLKALGETTFLDSGSPAQLMEGLMVVPVSKSSAQQRAGHLEA
ncbi:5000_t:CDS:2 [Paraglomus brasilianum]|uniref:5000_t:CDS:1 n=1 Tax=Paraglomus brasilianum TaxID=144538 RepID=A0A9N9ALB2_9GLOM|nr:5000_t:CDS:2 [Paraglomus brasilianum]